MTFERPIFLLGLVLAILPGAMYLSRHVSSRKQAFPAAYFVFGRDPGPLRRLRFRQIMVALARAGLVAALALAFAGPVTLASGQNDHSPLQERTVLLLDLSASMSARSNGTSAFTQAVQQIRQRVRDAEPQARFQLRTTAPEDPQAGTWLTPRQAVERIDQLGIHWGETHLVQRTAQIVSETERNVPIIVLSDLALGQDDSRRLAELLERRANLSLVPVGQPGASLGLANPDIKDDRLYFAIENSSQEQGTASVSLQCPDRSQSREVHLTGEFIQVESLGLEDIGGSGECVLRLLPDSYPADDALWFSLDATRKKRVLVVDGDPAGGGFRSAAFHVSSALRSSGKPLGVYTLAQHEFSFEQLSMADMLVLVDPVPLPAYLERGLLSFSASGGVVWIIAGSQMARWPSDTLLLPSAAFRQCATLAEHPFRIEWLDREDPWTRGLATLSDSRLGSWTSLRHTAVSLPATNARVLARFSDGVPVWMRIPASSVDGAGQAGAQLPKRGGKDLLLWTISPDPANGQGGYHPIFPLAVHSFLDAAFPDIPDVRVPIACLASTPCAAFLNEGEELTGGMSGTVSITAADNGRLVCPEPGPYYRSVTGGRQLALQCFAPCFKGPSPDPAHLLALESPERLAPPVVPETRTGFTPLFLLVAAAFLLLEFWLVSFRG